MNSAIEHSSAGTVFSGAEAVEVFRMIALSSALGLYAKAGIQVNRHVTPSRMLAMASEYTGVVYKRGAYQQASDDMKAHAAVKRAEIPESRK